MLARRLPLVLLAQQVAEREMRQHEILIEIEGMAVIADSLVDPSHFLQYRSTQVVA